MLRSTAPNNAKDDSEIARDFALVRTDTKIKPWMVKPHHPPLEPEVCGADGLNGHLVGYGQDFVEGLVTCSGPHDDGRYYSSVLGFDRESGAPNGSVFEDTFFASPFGYCDTYEGQSGGDSGGALIDGSGRLCGVISSHVVLPPILLSPGTIQDTEAAVDSPETIQWLKDRIIDQAGQFEGECAPPAGPQDDPDEDGIASPCDDCPTVYNPEQLSVNDDADGNGVGAACDVCPGASYFEQFNNCNYEWELAVAYPTLTKPPVLKPSDFATMADFEAAKEKYLSSFKPDACDPGPCPKQGFDSTQDDPSFQLPPDEAGLLTPPPLNCFKCQWKIRNQITLSPSAGVGTPANTKITQGLRYCPCDDAENTTTLKGRLACRKLNGCPADFTEYQKVGSFWLDLVTEAAGGWDDPKGTLSIGRDKGQEFTTPFAAPPSFISQRVTWDFISLGSGLVSHPDDFSYSVHGMLWAHAVSLDKPVPKLTPFDIVKFANTLQSGDADMRLATAGLPQPLHVPDYILCKDCPLSVTSPFVRVGNPGVLRAMTYGVEPARSAPQSTSDLYQAILSGSLAYVRASEPLMRLAASTRDGMPLLRGVAISNGNVSGLVESADVDEFPSLAGRIGGIGRLAAAAPAPKLHGNEAIVLSGALRRLFVIGGTTNGKPNGPPVAGGRMYSIDDAEWTDLPIPPAEQPGEILTATFRLEDRAVYLVDELNGQRRLLRWTPMTKHPEGGALHVLAVWPGAWSEYDRHFLVAGVEGDLVCGATRTNGGGPKQSLFADFTIADNGGVTFTGLAWRAGVTIAVPAVDSTRIGRIVPHPSGGALDAIELTAFAAPPAGQAPSAP